MNYMTLAVMFQSLLGDVESQDFYRSLELMGKGMLGIFIVMVLIFVLIAVLNKVTKNKDEK